MERRQINLVREYHPLIVHCQNDSIYTFGRSRRCQTDRRKFIRCNSVFASRKHFEVFADVYGVWKVKDLNSTNGTFVNQTQVLVGEEMILRDGDKIGMGIAGTPPYCPLINCRDVKYFIFKVVISGNCDLANPVPVHTVPFQSVSALRRSNDQRLMEAILDVQRMYRSHRQLIRRKQTSRPVSTRRRVIRIRVILMQRKPTSSTSALTSKILRRWYRTLSKRDKRLKRKLLHAVKKLWGLKKRVLHPKRI